MKNKRIKMIKEIIGLSFILILLICIVKNNLQKTEFTSIVDFPSKYVKEDEVLEFDTKVIVANNKLYESTATKIEFEKSVTLPLMFQSDDMSEFTPIDEYNYTNSNGNTLYIEENYLSFNSNSELEKNMINKNSVYTEKHIADAYNMLEEADKIFAAKAKNEIWKLLESIKINNLNLSKTYILDDSSTSNDKQNKGSYWLGNQVFQEIPVFCTLFYGGMNEEWMPIQALYTSNGIEKVKILYGFNFDKTEKKFNLKPFDDVVSALEKKYSMLLTDNAHIVTKAELSFWVDVNQEDIRFSMIPVWIFTIKEYNEESEENYLEYQELVNAVTAEMLEVGE